MQASAPPLPPVADFVPGGALRHNVRIMPTAVRRSIIAVLLVVAAGSALMVTRLPQGSEQPASDIIRSISPGANEKIPQQGQIKIELLAGWAGRLQVDQRTIPDNQINRAEDPTVASHQQLLFQPGPGKALAYFPAGQNCATLTYWQVRTGPDQSFTRSWCFTAF
jgi:hypothetical protein